MGGTIALIAAVGLLIATQPSHAIGTAVDLGTASSYSVLGGESVTNTGPSVLNAGVGVSPGTAVSGFPPGITRGVIHAADPHALQAQSDLATAYDDAAGQAPDQSIADDIGGLTLLPGVYNGSSSIGLTGPLTLNAQGDPDAVFIFQIGSSLTTATSSSVVLVNGARSCNVFWQIGASATLGTSTAFVGNIMAMESITATTGATIDGRALARNGSVTLDTNTFTGGSCAAAPTGTTPATGTGTGTTPTDTASTTPIGTASTTPTGTSSTTPAGASSTTSAGTSSGTLAATSTTDSPTTGSGAGISNPGSGSDSSSGLAGSPPDGNLSTTGTTVTAPLIAAVAAMLLGVVLVTLGLRRARLMRS